MAERQKGLLYSRGYSMKPGVYTAVVTPFNEDGTLDLEGLRQNLRLQIASGVTGIVILGTTGEAPTLEEGEKEEIIQTTVEEVKHQATIIVGTGSYSTKKTITATEQAKRLGADGALVVTPYYNKPSQEGLYLHFKAVAEHVDLPLMLYNIQGRTGQNIHTETLKRLALLPNIQAVKEASGNLHQIMDVLAQVLAIRPDFKIFSGDDGLTFPLMTLGGHGVVSVASNLIPNALVEMVNLALANDHLAARKWHFHLLELFKEAFIETNPVPIKRLMQLTGMAAGPCRLPLSPLSAINELKMQTVLEKYQQFIPAGKLHG
ncbi:4-hydroxy-tetrahydrodipicolinate synthase [Chlamydiales bacterium STE3]|nr:4-hydroxy-tetrahydrodipicolinate synthase [Chlamydiales bacterium STE3]